MPDASPAQRAAAYGELVRTLAALHSLRPEALGLAGFGACPPDDVQLSAGSRRAGLARAASS